MATSGKLPPNTALEILHIYTNGELDQRQLAAKYGVSQTAIFYAIERARRGFETRHCITCGKPFTVVPGHVQKRCSWECGDKDRIARVRNTLLRSKYGITATEYDTLLLAQDGKCAICEQPPDYKRLAVDHDHKTGKVRGLLCEICNRNLGIFEKRLAKVLSYLNYRHGDKQA